jgi:hypothetical protein
MCVHVINIKQDTTMLYRTRILKDFFSVLRPAMFGGGKHTHTECPIARRVTVQAVLHFYNSGASVWFILREKKMHYCE